MFPLLFRRKPCHFLPKTSSTHPFVGADNPGYSTLLNISLGAESGKSQAKFKKIAMEHYLHCMQIKIENGDLSQTNV